MHSHKPNSGCALDPLQCQGQTCHNDKLLSLDHRTVDRRCERESLHSQERAGCRDSADVHNEEIPPKKTNKDGDPMNPAASGRQ